MKTSAHILSIGLVLFSLGANAQATVTAAAPAISNSVTPKAATTGPNYQGLWWAAPAGSESGWGINFAHQGDVIFATWFTYNSAGKAWWLSMTANKTSGGTYAGTIYQTTGPAFDAVPFNPNSVRLTALGSGTLTFSDATHGSFAYTVNGVTQTKSITPQAFGAMPMCTFGVQPNLAAATNYQDLWWNNPPASESGWGINLAHQGNTIFATWFTYDHDGTPLWLSVTANNTAAGVYSGTLYRTTGPAFNAVPFNPSNVALNAVGTATFTFADGNTAKLAYVVSGEAQSKNITRQVFQSPGTVCAQPRVLIAENSAPNSALLEVVVDKATTEAIAITGTKDSNGNATSVSGVVYALPSGQTIAIALGSNGLPVSLTQNNGVKALFSNYTSNTVDAIWYDPSGNRLLGPITQQFDLAAYQAAFAALGDSGKRSTVLGLVSNGAKDAACISKQLGRKIISRVKFAGLMLDAITCTSALVLAAPALPVDIFVAYSCASVLKAEADYVSPPSDEAANEEVDAWGSTAFSLPQCLAGEESECASFVAAQIPHLLNTFVPECAETIPPGTVTNPFPQPPSTQPSMVGISLTLNTVNGSGTVTSDPAPGWSYKLNAAVTLTAHPAAGSAFTGWGGDCFGAGQQATCPLTMDQNKVVTATFGESLGPVPSCTLAVSDSAPTVNSEIAITATCSGNPTSYYWTGCSSSTSICSATSGTAGLQTYSLTTSNAAGNSAPASISATWQAAACSYTYSDWGACQPNNTQTRTVTSSTPSGCVGTPVLQQSCTYAPAATGTVTWTLGDQCNNGNEIDYRFFDTAHNMQWPAGAYEYYMFYGDSYQSKLSCIPGALVCYGATSNGGAQTWGLGLSGTGTCASCCLHCDGSSYSVNLTCPSQGGGTGGTSYYANWTCGSSSQCASVMGASAGSEGPFCTAADCQRWGNQFIPSGYSCSTAATYAPNPGGSSCYSYP